MTDSLVNGIDICLHVIFTTGQTCQLKGKREAEHLYSALHGIKTTLKLSVMDHTAFNLQRTPCLPLPRKRSPDGAALNVLANI